GGAHVARTALHDVGILRAAATAAARGRRALAGRLLGAHAATATAESAEAALLRGEHRRAALVEVDADRVVIAVEQRAGFLGSHRAIDAAGRPELLRLADREAGREAEVHWYRRTVRQCDERAALFDETLQVRDAAQLESAAHVVGLVLPPEVRRQCRALPRHRVVTGDAAHRAECIERRRPEQQHVITLAQPRVLAHLVHGDVVVRHA